MKNNHSLSKKADELVNLVGVYFINDRAKRRFSQEIVELVLLAQKDLLKHVEKIIGEQEVYNESNLSKSYDYDEAQRMIIRNLLRQDIKEALSSLDPKNSL